MNFVIINTEVTMDKNEIREKLEELSDRISPDGMTEEEKITVLSELDNLLNVAPDDIDVINSIKACKELMRISPRIKAEQASTSEPSKPSIMEKVSIRYILLGKFIILALIIYFCFMQ